MKKLFYKNNKIIYLSIFLVILFELFVGISVFNKIGSQRILISLFRTVIQIGLLISILQTKSKIPLYLFAFYHILVGITFFYKINDWFDISMNFGLYHLMLVLIVYFSEEISNFLNGSNNNI